MSAFNPAAYPAVYWVIASSIAVLGVACVALARRVRHWRRTFASEQEQFLLDLSTLQGRIEAQERELQRANAELAERARRLEAQAGALADAERTIRTRDTELLRAGKPSRRAPRSSPT
jgi:C4-dicarboxylate-specific signal transduction histidine kinase